MLSESLNGLCAPDEGSSGGAGEGSTGDTKPPATFEAFLEGQSPEVKALYEGHTKGLKSALDAERQQRSELARQLREAVGKAEAGSAAQKTLLEMQAKYEALERRQVFMDEAVKPETGCSDPRLAYLAAQEIGAISDKGRVDWSALREQFPALFKPRQGNANAGAGTQGKPASGFDMNKAIRQAAGRE